MEKKHYVKQGIRFILIYLAWKQAKDIKGNIEIWDKKGVEVTAYIDLYLKNSKKPEPAGRFYIGKKNKEIKGKKGDVYYGFLEVKNWD